MKLNYATPNSRIVLEIYVFKDLRALDDIISDFEVSL